MEKNHDLDSGLKLISEAPDKIYPIHQSIYLLSEAVEIRVKLVGVASSSRF